MEKQLKIKNWVEKTLKPIKTINTRTNGSYGLKHECERAIEEYVKREELEQVMTDLGYKSRDYAHTKYYNISSKRIYG
jgi:hypothetical protein